MSSAFPVWRLHCPDGIGLNTTVSLDGKVLTGVISAQVNMQADGFVTATLVVENVEVEIGKLHDSVFAAPESVGEVV